MPDSNVIYVFHFYEPHTFTHQGAGWGAYYWHWLKGLHYPSSPDNAGQVAGAVPEAHDRLQVIRYGQDHWDASRIEAEINQAADWARQRGVPLICNEFGVYRAFVDPQDRARWITDVRTSLERHNIGWAMWDYSGSFGVVTNRETKAQLDGVTVRAPGPEDATGAVAFRGAPVTEEVAIACLRRNSEMPPSPQPEHRADRFSCPEHPVLPLLLSNI